MAVLCGMPMIQHSSRNVCFFKLNDLQISTSLSTVTTDMSRDSIVDPHCLRQRYMPYDVTSRPTSQKIWEVSCTECTGQGNDFELIPSVKMETRHPIEGSFDNTFPSIYHHCGVMAA